MMPNYYLILVFVLTFIFPPTFGSGHHHHECERTCGNHPESKICYYEFDVSWYLTMVHACRDCPNSVSNCSIDGCITADGYRRAFMSVNRELPGPMIRVCQGDMIVVKVYNNLDQDEGLTIHWHGIYQKDTPHMDGAHLITQCPITRGSYFTYEFLADPPGTHWWHAHAGLQHTEGIAGPLIIDLPKTEDVHANDFDTDLSEHVIFMSDWDHQLQIEAVMGFEHSATPIQAENILVNGKGAREGLECSDENNDAFVNTFTIRQGLRSRFRVISNAAIFCPIDISVDNHMLTVIASDGADFEPYEVTNLIVRAGERYDFIVKGDRVIGNYWFRFVGEKKCSGLCHAAYLNYEGFDKSIRPTSNAWTMNDILYKQLNPVDVESDEQHVYITSLDAKYSEYYPEETSLEETPDSVHFIGADVSGMYPKKLVLTSLLNNVVNKHTSSPILTQPDDIGPVCNPEDENFNASAHFSVNNVLVCTYVIDVKLGDLVEIVIIENNAFNIRSSHSMHLHGQHFSVVAMDKLKQSIKNEEVKKIYENGEHVYKLKKAIKKDTVGIPSGGYAIIRFRANNPGVWLFHCHVTHHLAEGMSLSIRVGYPDDFPKPPKNFPRCGSWKPDQEEPKPTPTDAPMETTKSRGLGVSAHSSTLLIFVVFSILILYW